MAPARGICDPLGTCSSLLSHLLRPLVRIFSKLVWDDKYVAVFESVTSILLNTVTILLSHLLQDHLSDFLLKFVWDVSLVVLLCMPKFGAGPSTNMAIVSHLEFFSSHLLHSQRRNFIKILHLDFSQPLYVSPQK